MMKCFPKQFLPHYAVIVGEYLVIAIDVLTGEGELVK